VATFFIFIVTANLLALIPGFLGSLFVRVPRGRVPLLRSPNSDLTTTLALALFSVFAIQFFSLRALGLKGYLGRFFNFTNPIRFVLGFFEMISEGVKVLSFSFRLFGNIFAGEVLLLVIAFLIPYFIPLPFMLLEVFVGVIQAFVFAVLTLTFIKTSTGKDPRGGLLCSFVVGSRLHGDTSRWPLVRSLARAGGEVYLGVSPLSLFFISESLPRSYCCFISTTTSLTTSSQ